MMKLIRYELKKIFKSRINIILCLTFCVMCIYTVHDYLYNKLLVSNYMTYEGEEVSGHEYLRYLDDFAHEHCGEINDEFVNAMREEYRQMKEALKCDEADEEMMKRVYGENYQEYLQKGMSEEEFILWREECEERYSNTEMFNERPLGIYRNEDGSIEIATFYKNSRRLAGLNVLFELNSNTQTFAFEMLNQKEKHLISKELLNQMDVIESDSFISEYRLKHSDYFKASDELVDDMNQKYLSVPAYYDSVVGARLLCSSFSGTTLVVVMMILLNVILFSNIFSRETKNGTAVYLAASKLGYKQVTAAKLIIVFFFNLIMTAFYLAAIYFVVSSIVEIRSLDMTHYYTDIFGISFIDYLYTYRELIANYVLRIFISMLGTGLLTALLSGVTKNRIVSAIVPLLMLIVSIFIPVSQNQWIMLFPYVTATNLYFIEWLSAAYNGIPILFDKGWGWLLSVCLFWSLACIIMILSCYLKQRKHIVK